MNFLLDVCERVLGRTLHRKKEWGWDARGWGRIETFLGKKLFPSKLVLYVSRSMRTDRVKVIQNDHVTAQNLSSLAKIDPRRRREMPERRKRRYIRRAGQKGHEIPRIMDRGTRNSRKYYRRWERDEKKIYIHIEEKRGTSHIHVHMCMHVHMYTLLLETQFVPLLKTQNC